MFTLDTLKKQSLASAEQQADGSYTVRLERRLKHPIQRVWKAITDPAQVAIWLGNMKLDQRVGGEFEMRFHGDHPFYMTGAVTEMDPPHVLEYTWLPTGMAGNVVRWELQEDGSDATALTFYFTNVREHMNGARAGWHITLAYLEETLNGELMEYAFDEPLRQALEGVYDAL